MSEADTSRDRIERLKSIGCADYLHIALLDRAEKAEAALATTRAEDATLIDAPARGPVKEAARLARPDCASTWTLDPEFVMRITHEINRNGWDATMEAVELAMLAAERALSGDTE